MGTSNDWKINFTVKLTFLENSLKPTNAELVKFLFETLKMNIRDIMAMYQHVTARIVYIRCNSEEILKNLIEQHDGAMFKYEDGTIVRLGISQESESVKYVRVWGIPPDAPDGDVARFFSRFGTVKRVVREKYPRELNCPIETGVRGLQMELKGELPHFMYIRNFRIKVHYEGMKEKCHSCGETTHIRANCPKKVALTPTARWVQLEAAETVDELPNLDTNLGSLAATSEPVIVSTPAVSTTIETVEPPQHSASITAASGTTDKQSFPTLLETISNKNVAKPLSVKPKTELKKKVEKNSSLREPVHTRSRSAAKSPAGARDSSAGSSNSIKSQRGRPKKIKTMVIETIAQGIPAAPDDVQVDENLSDLFSM